jgi:GR25 family glycosyltransferase involved in LPS biosynthesis
MINENRHPNRQGRKAAVEVFVLTVSKPRSPRWLNCVDFFRGFDLDFDFVQGLTPEDTNAHSPYSAVRNTMFCKRPLSDGEVAVYMGHRRIWQKIVAGQSDVALIVEDDFVVTDQAAFLKLITSQYADPPWDVLKLFDFAPKKEVNQLSWQGFKIVDYKYPASGCVAYLITRHAAERLLKRQHIFRQVDEDLSWCWEFGLRVRSLSPNIVRDGGEDLGGSFLDEGRTDQRAGQNLLRRLNGIIISGVKQICAKLYLHAKVLGK